MTAITYWKDDQTGTHYLRVEGHANWASTGGDIVCAALSAISYSLLGFLLNAGEDIEEISQEIESGRVVVLCRGNERVNTAFAMAIIGYLQIEKQYPHNVDVNIAGTRPDDSRERP